MNKSIKFKKIRNIIASTTGDKVSDATIALILFLAFKETKQGE